MTAAALFLVFFLLPVSGGRVPVEKARIAVLADPFNQSLWAAYLNTLPRQGVYYVVEGDLLFTEDELRNYVVAQSAAEKPAVAGPELIINISDGQRDFWKARTQRRLHYIIDQSSFSNPSEYTAVAKNMRAAADAWRSACSSCGVEFVEDRGGPPTPAQSPPKFVVRRLDAGGQYIAASFFPSYSVDRFYLNVDPSYFRTAFDRVGVLRHELGHILGYRHEHIRGVPGCYSEGNQWRPLTAYDPKSVMHYFCGGAGSMTLALTTTDKAGHRKLYQ